MVQRRLGPACLAFLAGHGVLVAIVHFAIRVPDARTAGFPVAAESRQVALSGCLDLVRVEAVEVGATIEAAGQGDFCPGTRQGKAVPVLVTLEFGFALREGPYPVNQYRRQRRTTQSPQSTQRLFSE
jgi:hypothetical protein